MSKKVLAAPSITAKRPPKARVAPAWTAVSNEIAIRFKSGMEHQIHKALAPFGELDTYPRQQMMVLRRAAGVDAKIVSAVVDGLQSKGLIEFTTPVLFDPESNTRQVLTDEIVLRLKPGTSTRALNALKAAHGLEIGSRNEFEPTQYIVKVPNPSGMQTLKIARSLDRSDDVEFASPNFLTQIKR